MGKRAKKQFEKRFKRGIEIRFAETPVSPSEEEYRNKCLRKATTEVFTGLLGRKPTDDELLGHFPIWTVKGISSVRKTLR